MRIAVLNGPNLNLLGQREPEIYGHTSLTDIERMVRQAAEGLGAEIEWLQTNHEGALGDAVLAVRVPFVELHLSNIFAREPERRHSMIADLALGMVTGFGAQSYVLALQALVGRLRAA